MLFVDYIINIGGLIGFWQGLSIIDIKNKIYFIAIFINNKMKLEKNTSKIRQLLLKTYKYVGNKIRVNNL
jgi:hypothetical protein